MLYGYSLRKYDWKDWTLMIITSSLVLQVVVTLVLSLYGPFIFNRFFNTPFTIEMLDLIPVYGTIYGTIISLPLTLWIIYKRKIPLFNRKQLTKNQSFILRGLSKEDWKFLLFYIPSSYTVYVLGENLLINLLGPSDPVNQIAVESMFEYVPVWQMFLMIVIVAPIAEELLFRGMLLFSGDQREATWLRVCISSLAFGFVHTPTDLLSIYTYVGMGLIFSYAAKHTQTVEASIVYHFLNNLLGFIVILAL